jgi:hypothetical protein
MTCLVKKQKKMKGLKMERPKNLILTSSLIVIFTIFLPLSWCQEAKYGHDGDDVTDQNDVDSVIIALTRLDVNDLILDANDQTTDSNDEFLDPNIETLNLDKPTLELRWKIKNNSDQDIWICDSVGFTEDEFEVFMEDDYQTLLIRRRLDVPSLVIPYIWPEGQYVRLRAGEDMVKSLSITLPIYNHWIFTPIFMPRPGKQSVIYARHLVFEIGYHTKDLAQIILDLNDSDDDPNLYNTAIISYLHSANEGEQILRITLDGVLIPYEDVWVQDPHGNADAMQGN